VDDNNFYNNILKAFQNIIGEIDKDSPEHDVRYRFVKYFVEDVLCYEPKYIKWEKKRADLTIVDENDFAVIKIETKKPSVNIDNKEYEEQAFKYEEETTRFIGLTNFLHFKIWEIQKSEVKLRLNLDFSTILAQKKAEKDLSADEKSQILFLNKLTKETLFSPSKYEIFNDTYARIDITKDAGFRKLLDRLNYIFNNMLLGYTIRAFGEYKNGYKDRQRKLDNIEKEIEKRKGDLEAIYILFKNKQKLENEYEKYKLFSGFQLWKHFSGKDNLSDEEVKELFCKETIYAFINKLLFLRICEDKGLLTKSISNGGIEQLRQLFVERIHKEDVNKEIIETGFKSGRTIYARFYEIGVLDWFRTGDGELDELLNKILWILNQFDFAYVDRDILGNLYEKYLPSEERKQLGEFYTPTEIIDYILTSVGYTENQDIENKDILDPACGSGGFLVRASRILINRYITKFSKSDKKELRDPNKWKDIVNRLSPEESKIIVEAIREHIYGFDINPFACHIAEINLLFQIIDLFPKIKEKYKNYKLLPFKIYRTDSLEKSDQESGKYFIWGDNQTAILKEQAEINEIKEKQFDFVVGNPPYVKIQSLDKFTREYLTKNYESAFDNFDLYVVFIERGLQWLKKNGKFGYITSNQFMVRHYGKKIRKYIIENSEILHIVDFARTILFKNVTNYPTIIIMKKSELSSSNFKFVRVKKENENIVYSILKRFKIKELYSEYFDIYEFEQKNLKDKSWTFIPKNEQRLWNKLNSIQTKLGTNSKIILGLQTGKDPLFIGEIIKQINSSLVEFKSKEYKGIIESKLLKPILKGRNVRKWKTSLSNKYVIFPYKEILYEPIDENELKENYIRLFQYIKNNENKIRKRLMYRKTAEEITGIWYALMYVDYAKYYSQPKILTPALTNRNNFTLDKDNYFFVLGTAGVYGIIPHKNVNIKYLVGILNSKLSEYYLKKICPIKQGGYFQYSTKFLEQLPIKLPSTSEEKRISNQIIKKVDEILELHKSEISDLNVYIETEEKESLCNLPKVVFNINDKAKFENIRVDNNKIFLNSQDYIEIKDNNIRNFVEIYLNSNNEMLAKSKNVKKIILDISVPKSFDVLREIIRKCGSEKSQIKENIKSLEDEINDLVYKIYEITKEERKIIESSIAN